MSAPTPQSGSLTPDPDQLLSDHLDGWLSEEESRLLEQKLEEDASLRTRYQLLLSDRESLRDLFTREQSTSPKLSAGFAQRVVAETLHRQQAGTPTVELASKKRSIRQLQILGAICTTAAALMLAFTLQFGGDDHRAKMPEVPSLAQTDPMGPINSDGGASLDLDELSPQTVETTPEQLAANDSPADVSATGIAGTVEVADPPMTLDMLASSGTPDPSPAADRGIRSEPSMPSERRMSEEPRTPIDLSETVGIGSLQDAFSGAVLVYDIRLTPLGRQSRSVAEAMQKSGLSDSTRELVSREVIAAARRVETFDEEAKFQILFLKAPAKKLDRLFDSLFYDRSLVESAGMALVMDAPILKMTDDIARVDATRIRKDQTGEKALYDVDEKDMRILRELMGQQQFLPMTGGARAKSTGTEEVKGVQDAETLPGSGEDVMSRVLILVR